MMAQHSQPVAQQQQHQQPQQTQQQAQQQHTSSTTPPQPPTIASNASLSSNNQTLGIQQQQQQQQQQLAPAQSFAPAPMHGVGQAPPPLAYNQPLHSANMYMSASGVHQSGPMYPTMVQAPLPNVFVNKFTANVNVHGWSHLPTYMPTVAPHYIPSDMPPDQNAQVLQPMPVALAPTNTVAGQSGNGSLPSSVLGGRGPRRGRGRGGSGGLRRGDYNNSRHPPTEGSPAPQQVPQNQDQMQQSMGQQQQHQQQQPPQHLEAHVMPGGPHAQYAPHPQYAHAPPYPYYPAYFAQNHMIHPSQSAAAQQATGTPLYVYNTHPIYNYMGGYIYPPVMNPNEYQYVPSDDGQSEDRQNADAMMQPMWHAQQMYPEEYVMNPEMHGDELNHNASSMGSSETPSMISPNYPIYDPHMHEMQHQMNVIQIYDDPQMGHMQTMQQLEEDLSECSGPTGTIQMLSAALPATGPPIPMSSEPQMIHHGGHGPPQHLMQPALIGMVEPHTQMQPHHQNSGAEQVNVENLNLANNNQIDEATNMQLSESMINQQSVENIAEDYQSQPNSVDLTTVVNESAYGSCPKLLMTDARELNENVPKTEEVVATEQQQQQTSPQQQIYQQHEQMTTTPVQQQQHLQQTNMQFSQQLELHQMPPLQQQHVAMQPLPQHQLQQTQTQAHHYQQQQQQPQPLPQQQQQHEQRKQPQTYNQQSRRKYSSDCSSNTNINANQQHQPHVPSNNNNNNNNNSDTSIQTTKSMSWTNSSQHKKSTASVAVTATPTATNTNINTNSNIAKQSNCSYGSHPTKTYTNQQHHYHQQPHYQPHQQQAHYNQPQVRNYGVMKMPSSPIATAAPPITVEPKNSPTEHPKSNPTLDANTTNNISGIASSATTSTASTTAAPHQFPLQQQQQPTAVAFEPTKPTQTKQYLGFTSTSTNTTHKSTATGSAPAVPSETATAPFINLAPPASAASTANNSATGTTSWASLFVNKSNNAASTAPFAANAQQANQIEPSPAFPPPFSSKKPIAKVAPYEGITPVIPSAPIVTPGTMSYSAASAQGIPPAVPKTSKSDFSPATATTTISNRNSANLDEWSHKFADFLLKYKTDLTPISLRPRGLTNRSNYCYINSILQALLGCSPFYNLIRTIPKQAAALCEVKTPTINAMISFMSNFSNLPSGLRLRTTKGPKGKDDLGGDLQCDTAMEPTDIYKLWNDSREEHVEGRQEDAEEFLGYVLNKLNDELLEVIKLLAKPVAEQNGQSDLPENDDGDVWQMICNNRNKGSVTRQTDFGRTPLSDIFRGELRSRLQREGEHSTDVIQPFFTLQLNIEKAASVKEALEILVGRDQLEGVTGSKSKQEVVAWQQMNLEKLPVVLILHLKWFDYRSDGCTKILKKVEFPVELKIDAKILASKKYSQKQRAYRLFAVVYHDGKEASKGHYITDVYHTGYGSWLRYDDSSVKPVSENHVLMPRTLRVPYLLYYRRCDTMQPSAASSSASGAGNATSSATAQGHRDGK